MAVGELNKPVRASCCSILFAVLLAIASAVHAERLPIKVYTTADGLWSSSVDNLIRDSHGLMWFCTRDGVSSFDGYRFVNYRVDTGSSYPHCMIETRRGIYWIALNGGGLYRYDRNAMASKSEPQQTHNSGDDPRQTLNAAMVSPEMFQTLFEDREGRLWAGGTGLFLVEENNGQVVVRNVDLNLPEELQREFWIYAIGDGLDGSLWLGTSRGLLRRLPDGRVASLAVRREARLDTIHALMVDREGRIWFAHG